MNSSCTSPEGCGGPGGPAPESARLANGLEADLVILGGHAGGPWGKPIGFAVYGFSRTHQAVPW